MNIKPQIWRRIRVPASIHLHNFHDKVLCSVMGWNRNYHAYYFKELPKLEQSKLVGVAYGPVNSKAIDMAHVSTAGIEMGDDTKVQLAQMLYKEGQKLLYVYDLGDYWKHKIILESIEDSTPETEGVIQLLNGERACPPEDCGSIPGYTEMLDILDNPKHKDYKKTIDKLKFAPNTSENTKCDPSYFNLSKTQRVLSNALSSTISPNNESNFLKVDLQRGATLGGQFLQRRLDNKKPNLKCAVCGNSERVKLCGRCKIVCYCSIEHQKSDWVNHKRYCCKEVEKTAPIIEIDDNIHEI